MHAAWRSLPIVSLVTAPAAPPVTPEEAKAAIRVTHDEDDDFIESLVDVARLHVEGWEGVLRRALIDQTWRVSVCAPDVCGRVFAPLSPCSAFLSVKYYAPGASSLTTLAAENFRLIASPDWAYVEPVPGVSWPSIDNRPDALQVEFTCGYGAAGENVPAPIRHAIKLLVGHLYENREESTALSLKRLPFGVEALLSPYRMGVYG